MFIRTQDRQKLIPISSCLVIKVDEKGNVIVPFSNKFNCILGHYATKEKSVQILNEIQESIQLEQQHISEYSENKNYNNGIYEMPNK